MTIDQIQSAVDLKTLTTFGLGGPAERYLLVRSPAELMAAVNLARQQAWPYLVLAGGSNMVFPDAGYSGLIIHYLNNQGLISRQGLTLTVEASVPLAKLISTAIDAGLAGLEALSGIPGTVGGAIVGNAGAYGQGVSDHLTRVEVFGGGEGALETKWLSKEECQFVYRDSIFKQNRNLIVLRAEFKLETGDSEALRQKSADIIKTREKKYPPGLKCPGSFFKNVLVKNVSQTSLDKIDQSKIIDGKIPAGYLLAEVGAKGLRQGGVYIADYHGNLLVNDGIATYTDVITLATKLKKLVKAKFGIEIEEEVRCVD